MVTSDYSPQMLNMKLVQDIVVDNVLGNCYLKQQLPTVQEVFEKNLNIKICI